MKMIDLSRTLKNGGSETTPQEITYATHEVGAMQAAAMFGVRESDFPESKAWAVEAVTLSTHSGTHLDAPYHYGETCEGKPARTIDQVPLEWCFSDGVVLDFSYKKPGELITAEEVKQQLYQIGYSLKPLDIVLIRTDACHIFGEPGYQEKQPGMSAEATEWLIDQGIRVMGIDAWGWDIPFSIMVEKFNRGEIDGLWEAHFVGKNKEYVHLEQLVNLDRLPSYGFKVVCFPVKIEGASGGWSRVVAILDR